MIGVIGIGQAMRGDDAVGLEAVREWAHLYPETSCRPNVSVYTVEAPGLELLDLLSGHDSIVLVDAIWSGGIPGTVRGLEQSSLQVTRNASAHGFGVAEALNLRRALNSGETSPRVRVLGVEAANMSLGEELSPELNARLAEICAAIEREVQSLLTS